MSAIDLTKIEEGIIPIYTNKSNEHLINARELFYALRGKESKTKFADWIKGRLVKYKFVENTDYICFRNFTKAEKYGNKTSIEYYLTIDTSKELCMIENTDNGRKIRRYFIEIDKRFRSIINNSSNMNDFIKLALSEFEKNEHQLTKVTKLALTNQTEIEKLKSFLDIKIKSNYCLASDIAEQLNLYSENKIPHSNLIGAIARQLGYKISFKHFYEDEYISIIKDLSKSEYWQVYFKPKAVNSIINWFYNNKKEMYYEIQYIKNTRNGKRGEVKEKGYKIENICYKISN